MRVKPADGAPALRDGWRGLIDLGERWSQDDALLWPSGSGDLPVGEPLVYGCELRYRSADPSSAHAQKEAHLELWSLEVARRVMIQGAKIRLLDGNRLRATGELIGMEA